MIGAAFVVLAVYLLAQSAYTLGSGSHPNESRLGIFWLSLTFAVMLALAAGKARTGVALGNAVLRAEARVTLIDAYLAAAVLVGLVLNALLAWWWADPIAALFIVIYAAREGMAAWG